MNEKMGHKRAMSDQVERAMTQQVSVATTEQKLERRGNHGLESFV